MLFGVAGVVSGLAGAGTFIPYRGLDNMTLSLAEQLTVISAIGAVVSVLGVVSGWGLLRARSWAWGASLAVALASVGTVAGMAVVWPSSSPFLGVVAFFYALEVLLLLIGFSSYRVRGIRPAAG